MQNFRQRFQQTVTEEVSQHLIVNGDTGLGETQHIVVVCSSAPLPVGYPDWQLHAILGSRHRANQHHLARKLTL